MFAVLFEVQPRAGEFDSYLELAKSLRPELENMPGFVENIRYRSLTRPEWILSLSTWRDEQALVRWRNHMRHREAQDRGRAEIFSDYRLRVGELTDKPGYGAAAIVTMVDARQPREFIKSAKPEDVATWLELPSAREGLSTWDVFEAVLTPGDIILMMAFDGPLSVPEGARLRRVRVIRDYGMHDRYQAPH
jgi:heme-degrading monooxygenase HmoA